MAESLTWNRLRDLAGFRSEHGCAISLYLDLDPKLSPTPKDVDTRVNALLAGVEKQIETRRDALSHGERERLKNDVRRIQAFFDNDFSRDGAQGFAVFASGNDYWATLALAYPVPDSVELGRDFHLAPLAPLVGRGDGALVAVVGRERGELFRLNAGRLEEVVDRTEEQPGRHDQGGWSQARYQRHIEKLVGEHLRDVAAELAGAVRQLHMPKVIVIGSEETRSEFLETLPHDAKSVIAGTVEAEAHAGEPELLQLVQPLLDEAHAADETEVLERWREEVGKNARGSAGWKDTLQAASDARVELLLYNEGANKPARECPKCGRAELDATECPLDGTPMEERESGFDLAVHQTLAHGGTMLAVRYSIDLRPVEGIGALLRY
jgi:peptide chain release factor subunit 1